MKADEFKQAFATIEPLMSARLLGKFVSEAMLSTPEDEEKGVEIRRLCGESDAFDAVGEIREFSFYFRKCRSLST